MEKLAESFSSALHWMNATGTLPLERRKLLAFTDNRQDAALQAGHFDDFLFVALLRAAVYNTDAKQFTRKPQGANFLTGRTNEGKK